MLSETYIFSIKELLKQHNLNVGSLFVDLRAFVESETNDGWDNQELVIIIDIYHHTYDIYHTHTIYGYHHQ